ncbi:hypothetical protein BT69DRAFT_1351812 [Atractiella rhizophila]|nr:hypothetical protein BT69DRAFT_1351812 [Atractiella rhizophila]
MRVMRAFQLTSRGRGTRGFTCSPVRARRTHIVLHSLTGTPLSPSSPLPGSVTAAGRKWKENEVTRDSSKLGSEDEVVAVAVKDGSPASVRMGVASGLKDLLSSSSVAASSDLQSSQTSEESELHIHSGSLSEDTEHASAVGAHLALWKWSMKTSPDAVEEKKKRESVYAALRRGRRVHNEGSIEEGWGRGKVYALAQNLARELAETPSNLLTPLLFSRRASELFSSKSNCTVYARDEEWIKQKNMAPFLAIAKGSDEPPSFLEIHYDGRSSNATSSEDPAGGEKVDIALVGKGVTFDSGGISIKPASGMKLMRGDMGGAASVLATTWAIASLRLPLNVRTFIPLCENMPSGRSVKPGDIITSPNGKTIEVDNTDAEGRLILSDALHYALSFNPHSIVDVATLTGAQAVALGEIYSGVFTNDDSLWKELAKAGEVEDDPFWRMPLSPLYTKQLSSSPADLCNIGGRDAGACTAAAFLKEFVGDHPRWAHIDIAGTMEVGSTFASAIGGVGMSGRPTRGLVEWARRRCGL